MWLLDEHLPAQIVPVMERLDGAVPAISIHAWRDGAFVGESDARILRAAADEGLVLVTFDVNTIPALLRELARSGESHAGVVFVSSKSFAQNDTAGIARALVRLWTENAGREWTNRAVFLGNRSN